jgi:methionyl aminopeptidase
VCELVVLRNCFVAVVEPIEHEISHDCIVCLLNGIFRKQHNKTPPTDGVSCPPDAAQDVKLSLPDWANYYDFTGPLRPALLSPRRPVPPRIRKPDYADHVAGVSECEQRDRTSHNNIRVYTSDELDGDTGLRHACRMGREVLDIAGKALRPGVTTDEIDRVVHEAALERDCYPSPLNYYNFPKSVCTSVNEVICHGIPDYREVQDGGAYTGMCVWAVYAQWTTLTIRISLPLRPFGFVSFQTWSIWISPRTTLADTTVI